MALTANERAINEINKDNDDAKNYINTYLNRVNSELYNRALKLNSAMTELAQFMGLPPGAPPPSFWPAAFAAVVVVLPELALLKYVEETAKDAKLAITVAKTVQEGAENLKKGIEIKEKIDKHLEAGKRLGESLSTEERPVNPLLSQFSGAAGGPVNQLIQSSNSAEQAWEDATTALHLEYAKRLDHAGAAAKPKQALTDWMKGILKPLPRVFTPPELDQLERLYLWYLIGNYVAANAKLVQPYVYSVAAGGGLVRNATPEYTLEGLNDTQQAVILDQFGPAAPRGSVYIMPPINSITQALVLWHVRTEEPGWLKGS
ncbi:MAG TPA: hypothetical protein VN841_18765 [Bryobacteraceae bacterium]|nr:hypothetical protein [Bryobacteraceae bacterium]